MSLKMEPAGRLDESRDEVELVARLLRTAGSRIEPPREAYEQVFAAASIALEAKLQQRRRRRAAWPLALAASLVAAIAGLLWALNPAPSKALAGAPERMIGDVEVRGPGAALWTRLELGDAVMAQSSLRTGHDSRLGLRLAAGPVLRLAADTELSFESAQRLRLLRGSVYVDSGLDTAATGPAHDRSVEVVTRFATARDVGTQFEVQVSGDTYRLRVREGRVLLSHADGESSGGAGEQLVIERDGTVRRSRVALDDPGWRWIEAAAVAPDIENLPLSRVLAWVSRETGRPIRFATADIERRSAGAILHGSIRGLEPLAALETVLATSGLRYEITDDGSILISPA